MTMETKTKRLYLLGHPIAHSLSPAIQNAALAAMGLDWRYELLECDAAGLPAAAARLRDADCAGANVTIPHKETIGEYVDEVGASARAIGAINTVVRRDGRLVGENTDAVGLGRSLAEAGVRLDGARALVLGAGGAARAAVYALAQRGARRVSVVNRTHERAVRLVADLAPLFPDVALAAIPTAGESGSIDVVVDSLPPSVPVDFAALDLTPDAFACDLAYRPALTPFLQAAAARGARTVGGLGMLVHQAAASLEYWTGQTPPIRVMFSAAHAALNEKEGR